MRIFPFLPGLLLALGVWILPFAATLLPRRIRESVAQRAPWFPGLAPWIRNVGFPYAGLLLGWISSRDAGLSGQSPVEWILGLAAAVVLGILLARMSSRLSIGLGWGVAGDEARWTLYRAAVWPLAMLLPLAVVAALAAATAEFAWERRCKHEKVFDEVGLLFLTHAAGSAVLFLLAHNFFLAMLYYLTAAAVSSTDIRPRIIETINHFRSKK
jgi:hypothetical protein